LEITAPPYECATRTIGPLNRPQERAEVRRVAAQPSLRVRHTDRAVALIVQGADRAAEAGGVGPSAVDKDDCRPVAVLVVLFMIPP
jgi:hypothetical protein